MADIGNGNDVAKKALEIQRLLDSFDKADIVKALAHSNQILEDHKRRSTLAGKNDMVTWEYEMVQSDTSKLEQLFKSGAYNTTGERAAFIKIYADVVKQDIQANEGGD